MSNPPPPVLKTTDPKEPERKGPSLTLLYTLVAVALLTAMALATLIVLPFYRRR